MYKKCVVISFALCFFLLGHLVQATRLMRELREFDYLLGTWEGYWAPGELNDSDQPSMKVTCYGVPTHKGKLIQIFLYETSTDFSNGPKDSCLTILYDYSFPECSSRMRFSEGKNPDFNQSIVFLANPKLPWQIEHRFFGGTKDYELFRKGYQNRVIIKPLTPQYRKICMSQSLVNRKQPNEARLNPSVLVLTKVNDIEDTKKMLKAYRQSNKTLEDKSQRGSSLDHLLNQLSVDLEEHKEESVNSSLQEFLTRFENLGELKIQYLGGNSIEFDDFEEEVPDSSLTELISEFNDLNSGEMEHLYMPEDLNE